jgi:hypothetical protein
MRKCIGWCELNIMIKMHGETIKKPFSIYVKVPVSSEWREIFKLWNKMQFKRIQECLIK